MFETDQLKEKELKARKGFFRLWTIVAAIILTGIVIYLLNILAIPVGIIVWTIIIVFVLRTPVNRLQARGVSRVWGSAIAYVGMFLVIAALGVLLFSPVFGIGGQFKNLLESIPAYMQQISDWYNQFYSQYEHFFQNDTVKNWINEATQAFSSWVSEAAKASADSLVTIGGTIANSFVVIGFSLVVAFWILMELPTLGRECRRLIGEKRREDAEMLYVTFTRVMGGYIKATLIQCFLIGIFCGIAYAIIGIPNAAALGGIAGLLNIIPVVGPWLGGALAAIVGIFISPWVALLTLVVTIAIQQIIYTFVSPKLMADSVDVHPALVIIALLAGSAIGGAMSGFMGSLVGMLASIPAVAAMKAIFVYYFEKRTGRSIVSEDGVFFKGVPEPAEEGGASPLEDASSPGRRGKRKRLLTLFAENADRIREGKGHASRRGQAHEEDGTASGTPRPKPDKESSGQDKEPEDATSDADKPADT